MGRERGATSKETEPKFLCSILCIFQMHIWLSRWKWRVGIQTQHLFTIYDSYPVHRYFTLSQSRPTAGKAYTGLWGQNKVLGWSHCSLLRCSAGFRTQLEKVIIFRLASFFVTNTHFPSLTGGSNWLFRCLDSKLCCGKLVIFHDYTKDHAMHPHVKRAS